MRIWPWPGPPHSCIRPEMRPRHRRSVRRRGRRLLADPFAAAGSLGAGRPASVGACRPVGRAAHSLGGARTWPSWDRTVAQALWQGQRLNTTHGGLDRDGGKRGSGRQLLECTVRIDTGIKGSRSPEGGTGFITSYEHSSFLVTNRHVVADAARLRLEFLTRGDSNKLDAPKKISVDVSDVQRSFVFHEDPRVDVAVMPFSGIIDMYKKKRTPLRYRSIPPEIYLNRSKSKDMLVIEEVIVIGYPRLLRDEQTLTPIVRKGITATPIGQDFHAFRGFLIDAAIFEGSSGSPVFLYNAGPYTVPGGIALGGRLVFLGILASLVSGQRSFSSVRRKGARAPPAPYTVSSKADTV